MSGSQRTPFHLSPDQAEPTVTQSDLLEIPFDGYLKYRTYRLALDNQTFEGGFVHGPGHFVSAVAALAFDSDKNPYPVIKTGDTRLSRQERGEPYVLHGMVAGRLDKEGASAAKIVLAELAEEVGGEVVEGTFLPLGALPVPTMPFESSEADVYHLAVVEITGSPYGDGGPMEVVDLIGPLMLTSQQATAAMDSAEIAEGGRARTMYGRAYDSIGYLRQLGVYAQDHPRLLERFDSLGLGPIRDLRTLARGGDIPAPQVMGESLEARINEVVCTAREVHQVRPGARLIEATTSHAVREGETVTALPTTFRNQYLQLDYDRAKVGTYFLDPVGRPMVEMTPQIRPALAFAPERLAVVRQDIEDVEIQRGEGLLEQLSAWQGRLSELGLKTSASSGQSDLYYHFVACQIESSAATGEFVSLGRAIRLCREGHGDAHTEAFLLRLADHLGWIPSLGMSLDDARLLLSSATD